jgi:signal transduction histidine kinase
VNLAAAIALSSATLHVALAALLFAISRAPGWRVARVFATIALSAGLYSGAQVLMTVAGLPPKIYLAAGRFNYAAAAVHAAAWLVYAFGGADAQVAAMPRWSRRLAAALAATGAAAALLPGFVGAPSVVEVAWAGVEYHYPASTPLSDALGVAVVAVLLLAGAQLARRVARGEQGLRWVLPGMAVFLACAVDEVLVANRVIAFLSLADVGFVALVLPLSVQVVRRYGADAARLEGLTHRLEEEVRERTERLDRAKVALVQSERLASLGRMAAGVSHEINNPLAWTRVALDDVGAHLDATAAPADVREALVDAREGLRRIQGVAERLRSQVRSEGVPAGVVDLREVVQRALELPRGSGPGSARIETELAPVPRLSGDAPRLAQALANLVANAVAAADERGGHRRIAVRTRALPGEEVCVEVEDDGAGIRPEILPRLGEPYYTTRAHRGALGLGLFVARGIAEAHGGRLEIESRPGEGTRARLVFSTGARSSRSFMA